MCEWSNEFHAALFDAYHADREQYAQGIWQQTLIPDYIGVKRKKKFREELHPRMLGGTEDHGDTPKLPWQRGEFVRKRPLRPSTDVQQMLPGMPDKAAAGEQPVSPQYNPETLFQIPDWAVAHSAKLEAALKTHPAKASVDFNVEWKSLTPAQRQELHARGWKVTPDRMNKVLLGVSHAAKIEHLRNQVNAKRASGGGFYAAMWDAWTGGEPERYVDSITPTVPSLPKPPSIPSSPSLPSEPSISPKLGSVRNAMDIATEIHLGAKGNPMIHPDAPIKKGADAFKSNWMTSDNFYLMDVPLNKIDSDVSHTADHPPSKTSGPIIIEDNHLALPTHDFLSVPKINVLDGQHRLHEARQRGDKTIQAWVGEKAKQHLGSDTLYSAMWEGWLEGQPERYSQHFRRNVAKANLPDIAGRMPKAARPPNPALSAQHPHDPITGQMAPKVDKLAKASSPGQLSLLDQLAKSEPRGVALGGKQWLGEPVVQPPSMPAQLSLLDQPQQHKPAPEVVGASPPIVARPAQQELFKKDRYGEVPSAPTPQTSLSENPPVVPAAPSNFPVGDPPAMKEAKPSPNDVFLQHRPLMVKIAKKYIPKNSQYEPEDVVDDLLVKPTRSGKTQWQHILDTHDPAKGDLTRHIANHAHSKFSEALRTERKHRGVVGGMPQTEEGETESPDTIALSKEPSPAESVEKKEILGKLHTALEGLVASDNERLRKLGMAIALSKGVHVPNANPTGEQLSNRQIAERLGQSEQTIGNWISAGTRELGKLVKYSGTEAELYALLSEYGEWTRRQYALSQLGYDVEKYVGGGEGMTPEMPKLPKGVESHPKFHLKSGGEETHFGDAMTVPQHREMRDYHLAMQSHHAKQDRHGLANQHGLLAKIHRNAATNKNVKPAKPEGIEKHPEHATFGKLGARTHDSDSMTVPEHNAMAEYHEKMEAHLAESHPELAKQHGQYSAIHKVAATNKRLYAQRHQQQRQQQDNPPKQVVDPAGKVHRPAPNPEGRRGVLNPPGQEPEIKDFGHGVTTKTHPSYTPSEHASAIQKHYNEGLKSHKAGDVNASSANIHAITHHKVEWMKKRAAEDASMTPEQHRQAWQAALDERAKSGLDSHTKNMLELELRHHSDQVRAKEKAGVTAQPTAPPFVKLEQEKSSFPSVPLGESEPAAPPVQEPTRQPESIDAGAGVTTQFDRAWTPERHKEEAFKHSEAAKAEHSKGFLKRNRQVIKAHERAAEFHLDHAQSKKDKLKEVPSIPVEQPAAEQPKPQAPQQPQVQQAAPNVAALERKHAALLKPHKHDENITTTHWKNDALAKAKDAVAAYRARPTEQNKHKAQVAYSNAVEYHDSKIKPVLDAARQRVLDKVKAAEELHAAQPNHKMAWDLANSARHLAEHINRHASAHTGGLAQVQSDLNAPIPPKAGKQQAASQQPVDESAEGLLKTAREHEKRLSPNFRNVAAYGRAGREFSEDPDLKHAMKSQQARKSKEFKILHGETVQKHQNQIREEFAANAQKALDKLKAYHAQAGTPEGDAVHNEMARIQKSIDKVKAEPPSTGIWAEPTATIDEGAIAAGKERKQEEKKTLQAKRRQERAAEVKARPQVAEQKAAENASVYGITPQQYMELANEAMQANPPQSQSNESLVQGKLRKATGITKNQFDKNYADKDVDAINGLDKTLRSVFSDPELAHLGLAWDQNEPADVEKEKQDRREELAWNLLGEDDTKSFGPHEDAWHEHVRPYIENFLQQQESQAPEQAAEQPNQPQSATSPTEENPQPISSSKPKSIVQGDAEMAGKNAKAKAMQAAAQKRRETGNLAPGEAERERQRLAGNYKGKTVSVNGRNAKVVNSVFGNVRVQYEDGTTDLVSPDHVQERSAGPEQTVSPPPPSSAGIKMMITQADRANLRNLGWTKEHIKSMKPSDAQKILEGNLKPEQYYIDTSGGSGLPFTMPSNPDAELDMYASMWEGWMQKA